MTVLRSLWHGLLCIASFGAYPPVRIPTQTDEEAIAGDWWAVGDDLRRAIETTKAEEGIR